MAFPAPGYLSALLLTLVTEVPIVAACFPGQRARLAAAAAIATTATHLCMHLVLLDLLGPRGFVPAGEALALVVEGLVYASVARPRALKRGILASALANTVSFAIGLAVL
jgi:hypothetical protein